MPLPLSNPIPITQQTFLNATIAGFSTNQAWNEQQSSLNITLVEDKGNGDDFLLKEQNTNNLGGQLLGTPFNFQYGGFSYTGILESYDEDRSVEAYPLYKVVLDCPTKILAAVQVGLAGYIGPGNDSVFNSQNQGKSTFQVSNFLNVYGFLEDGGLNFGRSDINDMGIQWMNGGFGVYDALMTLSNTPPPSTFNNNNFFGSYIVYKNQYYKLDLTNLPIPPSYYRIGGVVNMTLLEVMSRFCQDGGLDYIVTLTLGQGNGPHTIGFITVPRLLQPQLGQMSQFIAAQTNISTVTHGQEVRDDITQALLVGGAVNFLQPLKNEFSNNGQFNFGLTPNAILPFWGFDVNGNPILGQKLNGNMSFADDDMQMNINGAAIADILGELGYGLSYPTSVLELRCALANYDTWLIYVTVNKPDMAALLRMFGAWSPLRLGAAVTTFGPARGGQRGAGAAIAARNAVIPLGGIVDGNGVPFTRWMDFFSDMLTESNIAAQSLFEANTLNHWPALLQRLYEFVNGFAREYYGKKFLVQLPFNINIKLVPNSTSSQVVLSDELADAGYMPEDSNILFLNYINENFFLDNTGRFYPFVAYNAQDQFGSVYTLKAEQGPASLPLPPRQINANLGLLDPGSTVVQPGTAIFGTASFGPDGWIPWAQDNTHIYSRCQQGAEVPVSQNGSIGGASPIFFTPVQGFGVPTPCTIVEVPNALFAQADDIYGNNYDMAALIGTNPGLLQLACQYRPTPVGIFIHPPAMYPQAIALAMKSNQFLYGPWGKFNTNGKLEFEQDEGLTPWDCGDYTTMNNVANARLAQIAMGNQVLERAQIMEPGLPSYNIGQTLYQDGPLINSISCSIGVDGVKTTYTLETFVNRIAAFSLENADILKRQGKIYQQLRRTIRQQLIQSYQRATLFNENYQGFMYGTTYSLQEHSPHSTIGGYLRYSVITSGFVPFAFAQTQQESVRGVSASGDAFLQAACMGMEGLVRAYTNNVDNGNLPWYFKADPVATGLMAKPIGSDLLNPFKPGCDLNWIANSSVYGTMDNRLNGQNVDFHNLRPIALRGPMIMQGWGLDFLGNPIPNAGAPDAATGVIYPLSAYNNMYQKNYLINSPDWPTAPIDLRFNKFHGTWISPGMIICGTISGADIVGGGQGNLQIYINNTPTNETMKIWNFYTDSQATAPQNYKAIVGYDLLSNKWTIQSLACAIAPMGGGGGGGGGDNNGTSAGNTGTDTGTDTGTTGGSDMLREKNRDKKIKDGGILLKAGVITH